MASIERGAPITLQEYEECRENRIQSVLDFDAEHQMNVMTRSRKTYAFAVVLGQISLGESADDARAMVVFNPDLDPVAINFRVGQNGLFHPEPHQGDARIIREGYLVNNNIDKELLDLLEGATVA